MMLAGLLLVYWAVPLLCCAAAFQLARRPARPVPVYTPTRTPFQPDLWTDTAAPLPPTGTPTPLPSSTITLTPTLTFSPTVTHTFTPTVNPLSAPGALAVLYSTGNVWVANPRINLLVELDGKDLHVISRLTITTPSAIAIWQSRGLAYISNRDTATLTEVNLNTRQVTRVIQVGQQPEGVAVFQATGDVFVANRGSNDISCIPASAGREFRGYLYRSDLVGPTRIAEGYLSYGNPSNPSSYSGATVVDSNGTVANVRLTPDAGGSNYFCDVSYANDRDFITGDFYADIAVIPDRGLYYVADRSTPRLILRKINGAFDLYPLKHAPVAVADLHGCVGVLVPAENSLYLFDYELHKSFPRKVQVGDQGPDGGSGLAYDPHTNTAYITNQAASTVTRLPNPCGSMP